MLLINNGDQARFDQVNSVEDLKRFVMGVGIYWTDGRIMADNGFKVVRSPSYKGLVKMLAARRFDFISRGLHELGNDINAYKAYNLVQEQRLLLKYDVPVHYCFFVNKDNVKLANRIERGLKLAKADGSFDKLFLQMPELKQGQDILQHSHRKLLMIRNHVNE